MTSSSQRPCGQVRDWEREGEKEGEMIYFDFFISVKNVMRICVGIALNL